MSTREIIAAATHRAAVACGLGAVTGQLATGLAADIVAVPGDPTESIDVLHRPACTLAAGRLYRCPERAPDNLAAEREGHREAALSVRRQLVVGSGRNG